MVIIDLSIVYYQYGKVNLDQFQFYRALRNVFLSFFNQNNYQAISQCKHNISIFFLRSTMRIRRSKVSMGQAHSLVFFFQTWKQKVAYAEYELVNDYNNFGKPDPQTTYKMSEIIKQQGLNRQEMGQIQASTKSFSTTSRQVLPLSIHSLDDKGNHSVFVKIQNDNNQIIQRGDNESSSSEQSHPQISANKTSVYHNFQKHLITTLKLHINFSNYRRSCSKPDQLMVQLWQCFLKSNKPTKRYLYSLLMNIPENIIQFKNKYREKAHQEEFQRIITQASQEDLCKAQKSLRFYLMKQCKKLVENGDLNHRRMQKINEFKEYFNKFINDLQSGELNLRLPKANKNQRKMSKRPSKIKNKHIKQEKLQ